jgi:hypothetical protein
MMKRRVETTSRTGIWVTKGISSQLINHARSRLLWWRRRRSIEGLTCIGSKRMRWVNVFIFHISLLKWSGRIALSFLRARRRRSLIWVKQFVHLLHILLQLLMGFLSPHVTSSQWHGEIDTCQKGAQTFS